MSEQTGTPEPTSKSDFSAQAIDNVGACMDACGAPRSGLSRSLWLGLMLLLVSFALRLVVLDFAISNGGSSLGMPRAELKTQAKLSAVRADLDDLEHEIEKIESKIGSARRMSLEEDAKDMDDVIDGLNDELKEKRDEARKLERKIEEKLDKVRLEGRRASDKAMKKSVANGADALGWVQSALTWKILVDLVKLLGCFLVLNATVGIVSSRDEEPALKVFATCCGTIVLLSITAWALLSYLS